MIGSAMILEDPVTGMAVLAALIACVAIRHFVVKRMPKGLLRRARDDRNE